MNSTNQTNKFTRFLRNNAALLLLVFCVVAISAVVIAVSVTGDNVDTPVGGNPGGTTDTPVVDKPVEDTPKPVIHHFHGSTAVKQPVCRPVRTLSAS